MTMVIDVLREEHGNIARLLDALEHQIDVFADAGAADYDVIIGVADYFLSYPDRCHHPKEDIVLARLRVSHPDVAASLGDLAADHLALHQQARRFRDAMWRLNESDIARDIIVATARGFIDAQRQHMRGEEERFLPLAEQRLAASDWAAIESALRDGIDPLFGGKVEAAYRTLSERLLRWEAESDQPASR